MTNSELSENIRENVKLAITHYARFYAELVGDKPELATKELSTITDIDNTVKSSEESEIYQAYFERRSQLMRIFHFQLMQTIEGQVQEDIFKDAEKLIEKLEVVKLS